MVVRPPLHTKEKTNRLNLFVEKYYSTINTKYQYIIVSGTTLFFEWTETDSNAGKMYTGIV